MAIDISTFSAAPSALGYLYQVRLALLTIVEHTEKDGVQEDRLGVTIEKFDDIAVVEGPEHRYLQQSKDHLDLSKTLTDGSEDVWKTLRVWIEASRLPNQSLQLIYSLFTTATAPPGSACELLRPNSEARNVLKAIVLLDAAAAACKSDTLKKAVDSWRALSDEKKNALLQRVHVIDSAPNAIDLQDRIGRKLFKHKPRPQRDEMMWRLEGWWYGRVISHLDAVARKQDDVIMWAELQLLIDQILADFGPEALPDEYGDVDPGAPIDPDADRRLFVHQMRAVNSSKAAIRSAIRDHWRASEQRSKWIRDLRLLPKELDRYDKRLVEEWEYCADEHCSNVDVTNLPQASDAGRNVLRNVLNKQISLRTFSEPYLTRGSYHFLADNARLGWHPSWPDVCNVWTNLRTKPNESAA